MSLFQDNPILTTALALAEAQIPVFPLNGKFPIEKGGFYRASTDHLEICRKWNHGASQWNIGVPTGAASNLFVVDVDNKPGKVDGFQSLAGLELAHGPLPVTVTQESSYGRHFFFRYPGWRVKCSVGELAPGIDIRGDGGYIVFAPSIHPETGKPYRWAEGFSLDDIAAAEAPDWLLDRLRPPPAKPDDAVRQPQIVRPEYGLKALRGECLNIANAQNGQQEWTLNRASYLMGTLIGAGVLDEQTAVQELRTVALTMISYDKQRPWTANDIALKIARGISDGKRKPRKFI